MLKLMVSCKFLFDDGESDEVFIDEWASSGGISAKDLVHLEKNFLKAIDWEIYVSELNFWKKLNELETALAARQGALRGYFTYTELQNLVGTLEIHNLIHCLIAFSVILAAVYTAGVLTLVGSVFLASHVPGTSLYNKKSDSQSAYLTPILDETHLTEESHIKTETGSKCGKNMNIINVLKTSILLASIKSPVSYNESNVTDITLETNDNAQYVSWDYWNIPIMDWLAKTSEIVSGFALEFPLKFSETSLSNSKWMELEDTVSKATKTRIQDQMESSWHEEWTDTIIRCGLFFEKIHPCYLQSINS